MMIERKARWRNNVLGLYRANKYWFWGSTIFFLLAASVYLIFTPVTYKVATRIVVKSNQDPEEIIKDVKSKVFLQKVIDQLPLQVVYYQKKTDARAEISKETSPVNFISAENTQINSSAELKIFIVNNNEYKILKDRTFMYFLFDEPVNYYSFAKFRIVKGPGFKISDDPSIIRVYSDSHLLQQYSEKLDARFLDSDSKSIELSLTGNSLQKGKDFLNKLVEIYNTSNPVASIPNTPVDGYPESLQKVKYELAALKIKAIKFRDQQAILINSNDHVTDNKPPKGKQYKQFLNVLNAIEPYANTSTNQFVLIPYGDEVKDEELKSLISRFNSTQLEKQHLLQQPQVDNSKTRTLNTRLLTIKKLITERITANKNEVAGIRHSSSNKTLAAIKDSIFRINALLTAGQSEYKRLADNLVRKNGIVSAQAQEPIIEKSTEHVITYPKIGYVYLFALLIGITLPLVIPYFKIRLHV